MAVIENVESVRKKLRQMSSRYGSPVAGQSVITGYTAAYALHVHENLESNHPVGNSKYLENPARNLNNSGVLRGILTKAMQGGKATLQQGLYLCGLRIQRDSQEQVPIDTGNLRGSAFTRKE